VCAGKKIGVKVMCKVADKSYKELCEALLGKEAYKVSELTAQKLYRLEDTDELKAYGLDKQKAEAFLCGVELGKRAFTETKAEEKKILLCSARLS
jgi:hypothetical protein